MRWKAADEADRLNRKNLLPEIQHALQIEKNLGAHHAIEFSYLFLRDGYILKEKPGGICDISIRLPNGGTSISVTRIELDRKGAPTIVADYLKQRAS